MTTHKRMALIVVLAAGCSTPQSGSDTAAKDAQTDTRRTETQADAVATGATTFNVEVWADNWSAMYIGSTRVMEDSVSITTERSFNEEVFTFEATRPFLINVVMKDFIENDSGLEYIGQRNQQMGDGGYIAQITDTSTGEVVAVSGSDWKCLTIHTAPLDKSCEDSSDPLADCTWESNEEPADWKSTDFDDSSWANATVHAESDVSPKDGYDRISWDSSASFIWGADLETHNTILCRMWVTE